MKTIYEWNYLTPSLETIMDYDKERFILIERYQDKVYKTFFDTKEKLIRDSLISLGWTPPK